MHADTYSSPTQDDSLGHLLIYSRLVTARKKLMQPITTT